MAGRPRARSRPKVLGRSAARPRGRPATAGRFRSEALLRLLVTGFLVVVAVSACLGTGTTPTEQRDGDEIVVCGELFDIGTPVVLWSDPGGYDAYRTVPCFAPPAVDAAGGIVERRRYGVRADRPAEGWTLPALRRHVRQFVLHYDVAGTSRRCFRILHDQRNLSVHFLLDVDGTIYQTLDLQERAWHGGVANDRSIGIEIAHIGAYPAPGHPVMRSFYGEDDAGLRVTFPKWIGEPGIRTPGFVARPARAMLLSGEIHGERCWMYDYTAEQHAALAKLTGALHRILDIPLQVPRASDGSIAATVLPPPELERFEGILGHYHVSAGKTDPGPALDWERLLRDARASAPLAFASPATRR